MLMNPTAAVFISIQILCMSGNRKGLGHRYQTKKIDQSMERYLIAAFGFIFWVHAEPEVGCLDQSFKSQSTGCVKIKCQEVKRSTVRSERHVMRIPRKAFQSRMLCHRDESTLNPKILSVLESPRLMKRLEILYLKPSNRTPRTADFPMSAMESKRGSTLLKERHKRTFTIDISYILSLDQPSRKTMSGQYCVAPGTQMAVTGRMKIFDQSHTHPNIEGAKNMFEIVSNLQKKACDQQRYDQFIFEKSHARKIPNCDQGGSHRLHN